MSSEYLQGLMNKANDLSNHTKYLEAIQLYKEIEEKSRAHEHYDSYKFYTFYNIAVNYGKIYHYEKEIEYYEIALSSSIPQYWWPEQMKKVHSGLEEKIRERKRALKGKCEWRERILNGFNEIMAQNEKASFSFVKGSMLMSVIPPGVLFQDQSLERLLHYENKYVIQGDDIVSKAYIEKQKQIEQSGIPCQCCGTKFLEPDLKKCTDCGEKTCNECWNSELKICKTCKKKRDYEIDRLKKQDPPSQPQVSSESSVSSKERYFRLKNILQMRDGDEIPLKILKKSLGFPTNEDFVSWLAAEGIIGLKVNFEREQVIVKDESAIDYLEMLINK